MNTRAQRKRAADVAASLKAATERAAEVGAVGFYLVALLPDGDYTDEFDCDDLLEMTGAVNDSALKARIHDAKGAFN